MSRRFVFIDESGDPGEESRLFVVAAVDLTRSTLTDYRRLMAPYRSHNEMHAEMKTAGLTRTNRPYVQACRMFCELLDRDGATCTVAYVDKAGYAGPYLGRNGTPRWPTGFRNFITRLMLESHFAHNPIGHQVELEVVFDRISLAPKVRENLEHYLSTNHRLPQIHDFSHVDSDYVDAVFLPDLAVTVVKDWLNGDEPEHGQAARGYMRCLDLTKP